MDALTVATGIAAGVRLTRGARLATKLSIGADEALRTLYGTVTKQPGLRRMNGIISNATMNVVSNALMGAAGGSDSDPTGTVLSFIPILGTVYSGVQAYRACF